ncbi:MAG: hypothetical protein JRJ69_17515 [Deltaproteobacteria bacterium]|nr:hypothetical protein [Deltaproteobacteria bacterium]
MIALKLKGCLQSSKAVKHFGFLWIYPRLDRVIIAKKLGLADSLEKLSFQVVAERKIV